MTSDKKTFYRNVSFSIIAQAVSICVGLVFNFFVPKYIDIDQFAYYQTYALYVAFVGIFHFGMLDGILLRYSEFDYDELDKKKIRSQFVSLLVCTSAFSVIGFISSAFVSDTLISRTVFFISLAILTKNICSFNLYCLQMTNRMMQYARLIIAQKSMFGVSVILMLFFRFKSFEWICIADISADILIFLIASKWNKEVLFGKIDRIKEIINESRTNISVGFFLLVSNTVAMLFTGMVRMFTQLGWSMESFAQVSYSFSLVNLFLSFVMAVSLVLFPTIKRISSEKLPSLYLSARLKSSFVMSSALVLYFPICIVMEIWLPTYSDSYRFMGFLLPVVIFSSSVSVFSNNFLNAYRKEREMFKVNVVTLIALFSGCVLDMLTVRSIELMLIILIAVMYVRAVWSENILRENIGYNFSVLHLFEAIVSICFVLCAICFLDKVLIGMSIYLAILIISGILLNSKYKMVVW